MNKYEIMYIVRSDMEESAVKEISKTFDKILTDKKAKIVNKKEMGQKKLAYEIKKQKTGFYFLLNIEASPEAIKEFDRKALIEENILRHLIIKSEE